MIENIKKILKRYIETYEKKKLFRYPFELKENDINYGIDAGVRSLTHPFLKNIEGYLINVVVSKDSEIIQSAQMILFCSNSFFRRESLKMNFDHYRFLKEFSKELGYSFEDLLDFFGLNSKTEDFLSKVRDFAEISMLYKILKEKKEHLVLRDGLFYFPYRFPGINDLDNIFKKYENRIVSISKSSKVLKDYNIIRNMYNFINCEGSFYVPLNTDEYYSKRVISFLNDYIVRFSRTKDSKELYHVQLSDPSFLSKINISTVYHYPVCLYVADKFSRLDEKEIKTIESKILNGAHDELVEIYKHSYKYQRLNWNKKEEN